jgi:hypothetical protein
MKGGNTDELYKDDGRLQMAQSLVDQHPDVARVSWKWGRHQHHVDYSGFEQTPLIRKPGLEVTAGVDNFGMILEERINGKWVKANIAVDINDEYQKMDEKISDLESEMGSAQ